MKPHLPYFILFVLLLPIAARSQSADINLVLVAGPNDHCGDNPCHQYIEDFQLLKNCLEEAAGETSLAIELLIGTRPSPDQLKTADALIIHSSADRKLGEWHALFPQNEADNGYDAAYQEFLSVLDAQLQRGMGLMVLHYSTWVDHPTAREHYLDWIGGYYRRGQSHVNADPTKKQTTGITTVSFPTPTHPILNGLTPWTTEAEYYYSIYFQEEDPRWTPLLNANLPLNDPQPHTVAWAVERNGGGRGVGFTGGHFHKNMYLEDYRKFILNAILWVAKAEVPLQGVASTVSQPNDGDQ